MILTKQDFKELFREVGWAFSALIIFLIIQAFFGFNELTLTILALVASAAAFLPRPRRGEILLFLLGIAHGIVIELVLGIFHRQQVWLDASLYNIPFWLPLVWGVGFIYIGRLAIFITSRRRG